MNTKKESKVYRWGEKTSRKTKTV